MLMKLFNVDQNYCKHDTVDDDNGLFLLLLLLLPRIDSRLNHSVCC